MFSGMVNVLPKPHSCQLFLSEIVKESSGRHCSISNS